MAVVQVAAICASVSSQVKLTTEFWRIFSDLVMRSTGIHLIVNISFSSTFFRTAEGYIRDNASEGSDEDELSDNCCGDFDLFDLE